MLEKFEPGPGHPIPITPAERRVVVSVLPL